MPASPVSISPTQSKSSRLTITHRVLQPKRRWPSLLRAPQAPAPDPKPDGAQADVPSDAPGGEPLRSESLLARAAAWVLGCLLICFGTMPSAYAQCSSLSVTLSPALSSIHVQASTTGTVWSGSITVVGTGCTTATWGGGNWLIVPFGTTPQQTTVSGIAVISTGAPTGAVLSGNCSVQYYNHWNLTTYSSELGFAGSSGTCSATMTVPIQFVKTATGSVSGTISASQLLATASPSIIGFNSTSWAWSVGYNGEGLPSSVYSPNLSGAPTITVTSTGSCTVSPTTTSVVLPTVAPSALATAGATAGRKPFTLTLTGCTYPGAAYSAIATWAFAPAFSSSIIGNTAANPKAANVGVQLLDSNLTPLTDGGSTVLASVSAAGSYSRTFYAQYIATGTGGSGNVAAQATFTLSYQ